MNKIPFHIISGFLGSGKTTFLKRIIEKYSGAFKLGIIQNEFAPSNIDGAELKHSTENFDLLEINNGSVFCVCLLGDFVRSLEDFIDQHKPEILIIEASGLSDTTSVAEVISAGKLSEKMYLASNWCIVDAPNFEKVGLMKQRVIQQIRMADVVLINKTDLAGDKIGNMKKEIKKLNPFAQLQNTTFCQVDFDPDKIAVPKFYPDLPAPMDRPDINSMVIKTGRKISEKGLQLFLEKWAPLSFRIKGFVITKEGTALVVQCTFDTIEKVTAEKYSGSTELVALSDKFNLREWSNSFKNYVKKF